MHTATLKELLAVSSDSDWALPHFNVHNPLLVRGVVQAAAQERAPVVLAMGYQTIPHTGLAPMAAYIRQLVEESDGMLALHFDHAKELELIKTVLDLGFSSVMFDGSALPFEENIALTQKVTAMAHAKGASVEAELGIVPAPGSTAKQIAYTDPDMAEEFMARTGVDMLAVSLGSIHGMTTASASLDLELLDRLRHVAPLVLHGASGVTAEAMRMASRKGVRKININTEVIPIVRTDFCGF